MLLLLLLLLLMMMIIAMTMMVTFSSADRVKQIKTKAVVNEDPTEQLLRELKRENERLRAAVTSDFIDIGDTRGMSAAGR